MKKKNILVTGSKGQLGSEIRELSHEFMYFNFFFASREDLDICDKTAVEDSVETNNIEVIINCAAYTAVDNAESEPELADKINHLAVRNLGEVAVDKNLQLIHISTDYVFSGKVYKPYAPADKTSPLNIYGKTKLDGENALRSLSPDNSLIIRTSWLYSSYGANFVKTMIRLGINKKEINVISDQIGTPTYAKDLAAFILDKGIFSEHSGVKIYHYSSEGACSWYDFAKEIMKGNGIDCEVNAIQTLAFPTPALRPFYSLMDKTDLKEDFNYKIPYWKDSLRSCLIKMKIGGSVLEG